MTAAPFTISIDTREQAPFAFDAWPTAPGTLATGDYSIAGLEELVALERKSLADLLACIGRERERFKRELHRLGAYRCRAVIVECDLASIVAGDYRGEVTPAAALGSIASWTTRYQVPFIFAGHHGAAFALAMLRTYHAQLKELAAAVAPAIRISG